MAEPLLAEPSSIDGPSTRWAREMRLASLGVFLQLAACAATAPTGSPSADGGSAGTFGAGGSGGGINVEPTGAGGSGAGGATGAGGGTAVCQPPAPSGGVHQGDLTIADAAGALAARAHMEITGTLNVLPSFSGELDLPSLVAVGGDLIVESDASPLVESQITHLRAQNLRQIGGNLWLYLNFALVETDFWKLESIGGRLYVHRNTALERLGMDSLTQAGSMSTHEITANPMLADCLVNGVYARLGWSQSSMSNGGPNIPCETTSCGRLTSDGP